MYVLKKETVTAHSQVRLNSGRWFSV